MTRAALFVDAGYLLAGAHDLLGGSVSRSAFDCDYKALLPALRAEVETHSAPLAFLRTYWYDGARDGIPTADHLHIGDQPYVKVRLGRLNVRGQQKGVDGLIYRDLTALARAGAVERAYLFTGDEDIRESVVAAQDLGVQVVLMSFKPTQRTGRSAALVREADEVIVLDHAFWKPHFTKPHVAPSTAGPPSAEEIRSAASAFAKDWAAGATETEEVELLAKEPWMPKGLYVQLLIAAEGAIGSLRDHDSAKAELRSGFWKALKQEVSSAAEAETPAEEAGT
ncbi:MAG: NYN domain-containing protein [Gaiellaceae bacterium]